MPAGRPSTYDPKYCQMVLEHCANGASLSSFAAEISVARSTINEWMEHHSEFSEAVGAAKAKCAAWWEQRGRAIAQEGGGPGAATLVIFGLKNMGADDWCERKEIDHKSSDGSMTPKGLDASKLSDETLREIIGAANAANR